MTSTATSFSRAQFLESNYAVKPKNLLVGVGGLCVTGVMAFAAVDAFMMATGLFTLPVLLGIAYAVFGLLGLEFSVEQLALAFRR